LHAVPMLQYVAGDGTLRAKGASQDEADLGLLHDVARAVAQSGLQTSVGDWRETKGRCGILRRLACGADVEIEWVPVVYRHEMVLGHLRVHLHGCTTCLSSPNAASQHTIVRKCALIRRRRHAEMSAHNGSYRSHRWGPAGKEKGAEPGAGGSQGHA